jgi:hypothetical protein
MSICGVVEFLWHDQGDSGATDRVIVAVVSAMVRNVLYCGLDTITRSGQCRQRGSGRRTRQGGCRNAPLYAVAGRESGGSDDAIANSSIIEYV